MVCTQMDSQNHFLVHYELQIPLMGSNTGITIAQMLLSVFFSTEF